MPDYAVDVLLYNSAVSGNCYKVRLLLAHLGIAYETVEMSVVDRSNRAEVLGDLNPGLRVPTLVLDDGRPLAESNAILWYLGEGTRYVPGIPTSVPRCSSGSSSSSTATSRISRLPASGRRTRGAGEFERQRDRLLAGGHAALDAMERHLDGRTFFVGERYSLADVALFAYTHVAHEGGFELDPYPATRAWLERVAAHPGHVAIDA